MSTCAVHRCKLALCLSLLLCGCQKPAGPSAKAAATPEELIQRFVAGIRNHDPEALANITAAPGDELIRAKLRLVRDIQAASDALEKQCAVTFGPREPSNGPVFGSGLAQHVMDAAFPSQPAKKLGQVAAKLVKQEAQPDGKIQLTVEHSESRDGQTRSGTETVMAEKTADGWKLVAHEGLIDPQRKHHEKEHRLLELLESVTREVKDGQFRHRNEVDFLMARELINFRPDVLMNAETDKALHDDAARLGLIPVDRQDFDAPKIHVEIVPHEESGIVRLRLGVNERESSPTLLPEQIQEIAKIASLSKGFLIVLAIRRGISPDFVIGMLHVMLDLRATSSQPDILLQPEAPAEIDALAPRLTGRLRLFSISAPKVNDPLRLRIDESQDPRESLSDLADRLKDDLSDSPELTVGSDSDEIRIIQPSVGSEGKSTDGLGLSDPGLQLDGSGLDNKDGTGSGAGSGGSGLRKPAKKK